VIKVEVDLSDAQNFVKGEGGRWEYRNRTVILIDVDKQQGQCIFNGDNTT